MPFGFSDFFNCPLPRTEVMTTVRAENEIAVTFHHATPGGEFLVLHLLKR
jgi:hypothetical protein